MEALDFLFVAGLWALFSPLAVSLLKNVGGTWPQGAKQALAFGMALLGSVVAVGQAAGFTQIDLSDIDGFWKPLVVGVAGILGTQYVSYVSIWEGTKVETVAASLGATE